MTEAGVRRAFFRQFLREAVVAGDQARGIPQVKLTGLPGLDDKSLGALMPLIAPGTEIIPGETETRARRAPGEPECVLFGNSPAALFLFNQFNGRTTLDQAARALSAFDGSPLTDARIRARRLFLRLVGLRVCVPGNPPPA